MRLSSRAKFGVFSVAFVALALACVADARAGSLLLENSGSAAVICQPAGSGLSVSVSARGSAALQPPPGTTIEDLSCGSLSFGQLDLSTNSGDRLLFLNGRQTRTLRSALFPYIPTPGGNFDPLVKMIATGFQALHPDIALEIVISQDVDPYDYASFPTIFGAGGFDTVEVDTSLLSSLVGGRYIVAMPAVGEPPLPFAARAVQAPMGMVYGIPTWICRDFFYSYDRGATGVTSLPLLLTYLDSRPLFKPSIAAIFNGRWTLLSLYLNGVVSTYGYSPQSINYALTQPVDSKVIDGLAEIAHRCTMPGTTAIPCIDNTYKNAPDGSMERAFASGSVSTDVGYSERSFFMLQTQPSMVPYLVQMPYGPTPVPMMFVDALVRSAARCANDPCATDANAFALYMSRASVRSAISFTDDVPESPARHLLPANASFYLMPRVRTNQIMLRKVKLAVIGFPSRSS